VLAAGATNPGRDAMAAACCNEVDDYAARRFRDLTAAGLIPAGDVDDRSIRDVRPDGPRGYAQVHLSAGIGGWALAAAEESARRAAGRAGA
jgi:hypothetical protein